jgi:hypothetical protein
VIIRKLFAKPLQESEAVPESLRTIDQRVRRDADPNFPPRNQTCPTNRNAALAALKQFSSQPAAETGTFHHLYIFHMFRRFATKETEEDSVPGASPKSRKL